MATKQESSQSAASSPNGPEMYNRMAGAADTHGPMYEVKMAALLFLRAMNERVPFKLFSNVARAGKFDDIVMKYQTTDSHWHTCFLQMKHKTSSGKISWQALNAPKGDFSLQGLYDSYCEIKKNMHDSNDGIFLGNIKNSSLALFSNAQHDLSECDIENKCGETFFDTFLKFDAKNVNIVRLRKGTFYVGDRNKDEDEKVACHEFLNQFIICSGMPKEEELDEYVAMEIMKAGHVIDFDEIEAIFVTNMKCWSLNKGKQGTILNENSDIFEIAVKEARAQGSLERRCADLYLDVEFEESCLGKLKKSIPTMPYFLHIIHSDNNPKITFNKLLQVFKGDGRLYYFLSLSDPKYSDRFVTWKNTKNRVLVLVADIEQCNEGKCEDHTQFLEEIHNIFKESSNKGVILISSEKCVLSPCVMVCFNYKTIKETFTLKQIINKSLMDLLSAEVNFQEYNVLKKEFGFVSNSDDIKPELANFILSKDTFKIGKCLMKPPSYYIGRTLQTHNFIKKGIFKSELQDKYAITSSRPTDAPLTPKRDREEETAFVFLDPNRKEMHFEELCQQYKNVHWLHETEAELFWKRTHGSIHEVLEHLEDNIQSTYSSGVVLNNKDKVVVLSAEPGMGKSTLMTSLALETKQTWPLEWVIYVQLKDYYEEFEKEDFKPAETFNTMATHDCASPVERELLAHTLNINDKVHVFIDGYDEISEHCIQNVKLLLQYLLEKKVKKLWISTRYCRTQDLELFLNSITYTITSFSETDQINFFNKYWNGKVNESCIRKLIDLLNCSLNETEKKFTTIPLQCSMIGEIYKDNPAQKIENLSKRIDISVMYKEFIQRKYRIFYEEKIGISVQKSPRLFKNFCDAITLKHTAASMILLLDKPSLDCLSYLNVKKVFKEFAAAVQTGDENIGIIDKIIKGKPNFVHRAYAEFYFGNWLADNYKHNRNYIIKHLYMDDLIVVRSFFDRFLCQGCELHSAVLSVNHEQLEKVLDLGIDLNKVDKGGRTALHLASAVPYDKIRNDENVKIVKALLNASAIVDIQDDIDHGVRVDIQDDVFGWRPLRFADHVKAYGIIDTLLTRERITEDDLIETKNIISNDGNLKLVVELGCANIINFLLKYGLDSNFVFKEYPRRSLVHITAEYGQLQILKLLIEKGGDMGAVDEGKQTPLHRASLHGHVDIVDFLINNISNNTVEVADYVNQRDTWGYSAVHRGAEAEGPGVLKRLVEAGGDLTLITYTKSTTLMTAALFSGLDTIKFILNHLEMKGVRCIDFINMQDRRGYSAVIVASSGGQPEVVEYLASRGADLTLTNFWTYTVLHEAVDPQHVSSDKSRLDVVNVLLSDKESRRLLLEARDSEGRTAEDIALEKNCTDFVKLLSDAATIVD